MNIQFVTWTYEDEQGFIRRVVQYVIDFGYDEVWTEFNYYEDTGQLIYKTFSTHMYI